MDRKTKRAGREHFLSRNLYFRTLPQQNETFLQYILWSISDTCTTQMRKLTFVVQQTSICVKQSLDFSLQFWKCWPRECSLFPREYLKNCLNSSVHWKQRYFHHCYEHGRVHKQECEHYYQEWAPAQRFEMVEKIRLKIMSCSFKWN